MTVLESRHFGCAGPAVGRSGPDRPTSPATPRDTSLSDADQVKAFPQADPAPAGDQRPDPGVLCRDIPAVRAAAPHCWTTCRSANPDHRRRTRYLLAELPRQPTTRRKRRGGLPSADRTNSATAPGLAGRCRVCMIMPTSALSRPPGEYRCGISEPVRCGRHNDP